MTTTQLPDVDRTHPAYKVGAATTAVDSLLDGSYGELPGAARRKLADLRRILTAERSPNACGVYGHDGTRCVLPAGHPVRPDGSGHDLRVVALPSLRLVAEPTPNGAAIRERIR